MAALRRAMALTSRGVLALIAAASLLVAVLAARADRPVVASWLMAAGFAVVTLWTAMGVAWAHQYPRRADLAWRSWAMLGTVALVLAARYGYRASRGEGPT